MSSTNKTTNYELPQWIDTDKPTYLGDQNGAYLKIDEEMFKNATLSETANLNATQAKSSVATLQGTVQSLNEEVTQQGQQLATTTLLANSTATSLNGLIEKSDTVNLVNNLGSYLSGSSPRLDINKAIYRVVNIGELKFLNIHGHIRVGYVGSPSFDDITKIHEINLIPLYNALGLDGDTTFYVIGTVETHTANGVVENNVTLTVKNASTAFNFYGELKENGSADSFIDMYLQCWVLI